jgi:hypothetical protein
MSPPGILLATWLAMAQPSELSPVQAEAIAAGFSAALQADDLTAFAPLAGGPPTGPGWTSPTRLVEAVDAPTLRGARVLAVETSPAGSVLLSLEVEGSALAAGNHEAAPLPRWWSLELTRDAGAWRIVSAQPTERWVAAAALAGPVDGLETALRARPELDPERFLLELADLAAERGQGTEPALHWAQRKGRELDLPDAECGALESLSYLALIRGEIDGALARADECLALAERALAENRGSGDALAGALFSRGIALWFSDRLDEAVSALAPAGGRARRAANPGDTRRARYKASQLE